MSQALLAWLIGPVADYLGVWLPPQLLAGVGIGLVWPGLSGAAVLGLPLNSFGIGRSVARSHLRASGRQESAIADELIDFRRRKSLKAELLDASPECAAQVRPDAATYDATWDDAAFRDRVADATRRQRSPQTSCPVSFLH